MLLKHFSGIVSKNTTELTIVGKGARGAVADFYIGSQRARYFLGRLESDARPINTLFRHGDGLAIAGRMKFNGVLEVYVVGLKKNKHVYNRDIILPVVGACLIIFMSCYIYNGCIGLQNTNRRNLGIFTSIMTAIPGITLIIRSFMIYRSRMLVEKLL